jgi:ankyrin repeat protein
MSIRKSFFIIWIGIFVIVFNSCSNEKGERTRVRTTDFEIPDDPPAAQQNPPEKMEPFNQQDFLNACLEGQIRKIEATIEQGVDITVTDQDGRSGLMLASFNGHSGIVEKLIAAGAEVNKTDLMGRTSLMYASTGHYPETVKVLLSNGAETNITDNVEHFTALMFAGAEGNPEVIKLLLEYGADPGLEDIDGDTAESFARQNGHEEAAAILKKATG